MDPQKLPLLVTLQTLLQERSIRETAHLLGLSSSAVSRQLAELRTWAGDPLLVRVGNQMEPTPRAREIGAALPGRLRALQELMTRGPEAPVARRFVIACADAFYLTLLPLVTAHLQQTSPALSLSCVAVEAVQPSVTAGLIGGAVDLYLGPPLGREEGTLRRKLFEADFCCVARRDHPRLAAGLDLDTFCALSHVLVVARFPPRSLVDERLAALERQRRVAVETASFIGAVHLVACSELIATLPRLPAAAAARQLPVDLWTPPFALPTVPIYLSWPERLTQDPAHGALREAFVQAAQTAGGSEGSVR